MTESQKKVIMVLSVVGERGRVTVPAEIWKKLNLQKGEKIALTLSEGRVIMQPVQTSLLDFFGSVKVYDPQDFNAVRKQVLAARAERGK